MANALLNRPLAHSGYKLLYRFRGGPNGQAYDASLLNVNGTLYGTTPLGGKHLKGSVFSLSTSGKERTVYSFKGGNDGEGAYAGLIAVNGTLYGVTISGGGTNGCGTVFSLSTSGSGKNIYILSNVGAATARTRRRLCLRSKERYMVPATTAA